jgi:hypothetical protein
MDVTFKTGSQIRYMFVYKPEFEAFKLSNNHSKHYATNVKGKKLSINLIGHKIGLKKSTPLQASKLKRSLKNGKHPLSNGLGGILERAGLTLGRHGGNSKTGKKAS